nr:MAG TPA: hypothetical protein [Caudoviricetes sp.]
MHPYRSRLLTGFYSEKCGWPASAPTVKKWSTCDLADKHSDI